jgi:hypothetical protein
MPLSRDPAARERQLQNLRDNPAPPAPPGNTLALKHGGYGRIAAERLDAKTREIYEALSLDAPLRDGDGGLPGPDTMLVALLAQCLARLEGVQAYLTASGVLDECTGEPRPAAELERRLRLEAVSYLDRLGCSPASRARLGVDLVRMGANPLAKHLDAHYGGGR